MTGRLSCRSCAMKSRTATGTSLWAGGIPKPALAGIGARSIFRRRSGPAYCGRIRRSLPQCASFLNGYFIGRNDNGYAPFRFDLTDFLNYDGKNYLVVRMDASFGDGWFYEGAGIYRHVWLTKTDALHLGHWDSYVRTDFEGKYRDAEPRHGGAKRRHAGRELPRALADSRRIRENRRHGRFAHRRSVAADRSATFTATANLANPALWSPETPNLYSAIVTVESAGKPRDAERITFGVRDYQVGRRQRILP